MFKFIISKSNSKNTHYKQNPSITCMNEKTVHQNSCYLHTVKGYGHNLGCVKITLTCNIWPSGITDSSSH